MSNEPTKECSRLRGQKMGRSRGAEGPISVQKLKEDRPSWQKRNGIY